jgi:S-formylglutathione hydrolase FrmB
VYLPPQYFQKRYAHTRFPVLELLHGSPGTPTNWVYQINIAGIMDKLISSNLVGPMIVVLPAINSGGHFEDCVDSPGALDDTYISQDVPRDVRARFRAATTPAEWGIAGYSSGGYCSANLALRHRGAYGAAAIMDGYFRPTDGPAAAALHFNGAAEAQNNPIVLASKLNRGANPMPSLWLSSGTGASKYSRGAQAFIAALHGVEAVTFVKQPGAGHNFYAWRAVIPRMLGWMWTQLAPPDLRVQFPVAGSIGNSIVVPPLPNHGSPSGSATPQASRPKSS